MNPDKLKIFKEELKISKVGGLSEQERKRLEKLFLQLSKEKQDEVLAEKSDLTDEPEKTFFDSIRTKLKGLREDVEKKPLKGGFEELKNNYESSEITKEFFDIIESYINLKLDGSFSLEQKDKIKLALVNEIESGFKLSSIGSGLLNKVLKPLRQKLDKLKGGDFDEDVSVEDIPGISDIENSFDELFKNFGLDLKIKELDEKIKKINDEKDSGEITDLESIITIINPDNSGKISYATIKEKTDNLVGILNKSRNIADGIQKVAKKLPFGIGDAILGWIKGIIKKGGFWGVVLGLIFGKEFMDESKEKQQKSIKNFAGFIDDNDSVLNSNITEEEIEKLEPKKLEKFYKYLDSKGIDYTKKDFWKGLLTGKTKDKKLEEIYKLLKNDNGNIIVSDEKLGDLVSKLNNLEDLESKKEQQNLQKEVEETQKQVETGKKDLALLQKQRQKTKKQVKKTEEQLQKTTSAEEKKKIEEQLELARKRAEELRKEEEKKQRELKKAMEKAEKIKQEKDFKESVNNITELPAEISYKGEKLILNIENNQIVLGKDRYNIKILAKKMGGTDIFKNISFDGKHLIIERGLLGMGKGKDMMLKNDLIGVIKELIDSKNYKKDFFDKKTKKLKANLIIEKA